MRRAVSPIGRAVRVTLLLASLLSALPALAATSTFAGFLLLASTPPTHTVCP